MALSEKPLEYSVSAISTAPSDFLATLPELAGHGLNRIHIDVMDGSFVPRFGLYPEFVREVRGLTDLPIDIHMMIREPEEYVDVFVGAGASRIVAHVEPVHHLQRLVTKIRASGAEAGLALNPHTDFRFLRYLVPEIHALTLMAINPGIVGHQAIPSTFKKLSEAREFLDGLGFQGSLEVDGGVTFDNVGDFASSGADTLVVGAGTIFHPSDSLDGNVARLRALRGSSS